MKLFPRLVVYLLSFSDIVFLEVKSLLSFYPSGWWKKSSKTSKYNHFLAYQLKGRYISTRCLPLSYVDTSDLQKCSMQDMTKMSIYVSSSLFLTSYVGGFLYLQHSALSLILFLQVNDRKYFFLFSPRDLLSTLALYPEADSLPLRSTSD